MGSKKIRGNVGTNRVELIVTDSENKRTEIATRIIAGLLSNPTLTACSTEKLVEDGIAIADMLIKKLHG